MENYVIVKDENNIEIKIEIILSFVIEEYNKQYIAYTLNDDGVSNNVEVFLSEIDFSTKKLKSIPSLQKEAVLEAYEQAKLALDEN